MTKPSTKNTMRRFRGSLGRDFAEKVKTFQFGEWHLHYENSTCHKFMLVTKYLADVSINTVSHFFYIPDLDHCDFCMFQKLKERLKERSFDDERQMKVTVTSVIEHCYRG